MSEDNKNIPGLIDFNKAFEKNWDRVMKEEEEKYGKLPRIFDPKKKEGVEMIINEP